MTDAPIAIDGPRRAAASGPADSLVVLLHGYGANGADLFGLAEALAPVLPNTAFASPNAPETSVVNPMGYQWFPIPWIDGSSEAAMREGFFRAQGALTAFLEAELARHNLTEDRLALIGFSQGTMMSLHWALRRPSAMAGVVGFSGRLVEGGSLKDEITATPPVLLVHGDQDEVIPVAALAEAETALTGAGVPVKSHVSRGIGHGIAPDGLQLAAQFLRQILPPRA